MQSKIVKYKEDWQSLKQHKNPEWLKDAKFGIYTHWTPATVATKDNNGDWYGYCMYMSEHTLMWNGDIRGDEPHPGYKYHVKKYGDPKEFGYKDLIKLFQPKRFNAEEWAELFQKSGAKFAGPVAMHHDNFAMWDSEATRWNIKKNSGFDAVGELKEAINSRGMRFVTAFHHAYTWHFFSESHKFDGGDPQYEDLYCEPHERIDPPSEKFEGLWYDKLDEVMINYQPDIIWFDFGLEFISAQKRKEFMARYFNLAEDWQKDVGVCYKIKANPAIPREAGIVDFELGRSDRLLKDFWMTDTSIGPWFYQDKIKDGSYLKTANELITMLVDIISKNGCLMLNIPPTDDGEIIPAIQNTLMDIGKWLEVNGEAVYNTRPWKIYGEGPTELDTPFGGFNEKKGLKYTPKDIRYTRSKDNQTLYASVLSWPGEKKQITLKAFSQTNLSPMIKVKDLSILCYDGDVEWTQTDAGIVITMPDRKVHDVVVVKIKTYNNVMDVDVKSDFVPG